MMADYGTRDFYRYLATQPDEPGEGWSEDFPLPHDAPDWDWPDAPEPADPRVNDFDRHFAWGWLLASTAITLSSLAYLAAQVQW